jgi:hypothetical protein
MLSRYAAPTSEPHINIIRFRFDQLVTGRGTLARIRHRLRNLKKKPVRGKATRCAAADLGVGDMRGVGHGGDDPFGRFHICDIGLAASNPVPSASTAASRLFSRRPSRAEQLYSSTLKPPNPTPAARRTPA